jgi:hypothetical protein
MVEARGGTASAEIRLSAVARHTAKEGSDTL